ncbi:Hsp33 family molecular chaperone HslO [Advenella mimigardefordensis]|uniref:33 kDa chaperonin n=1 Tax=Advenella mimigardefordensis (strain DSM 17166 / LMG 22922 / DPN7) TaxID=1247726 RepID=W0P9Y7_ADVMD|nr:Hsp33 family molecular chaperone HslO [Advenella mimigardefordensis]AHG63551.1 33 kDa chaperonin [Advenella mimigardefordensis DPN7]
MTTDQLQKYLLDDRSTRIQTVDLTDTWHTGLAHQSYPPVVRDLLGELCAASVLLASNIKFDGSLVLQLQGDGALALIVVECQSDLSLRATVQLRQEFVVPDNATFQSLLNGNGNGRFIVILDPADRQEGQQPYQGVVPMEGDSVAKVLEHYMKQSEQLDTHIWLAANEQRATGLLLQRLPDHGGTAEDAEAHRESWQRAGILAQTLTQDEMLSASPETLIHRLFWEEPLLTFEPQPVRWFCPCTRERVGNMLKMLGRAEIESILSEQEKVDIACNFCGKPYTFDAIDCARLFIDGQSPEEPSEPVAH